MCVIYKIHYLEWLIHIIILKLNSQLVLMLMSCKNELRAFLKNSFQQFYLVANHEGLTKQNGGT